MKYTDIKILEFNEKDRPKIVDIWYMSWKRSKRTGIALLDTHLIRCFQGSIDKLGYIDNIVSLINRKDVESITIKKYHNEIE